MAFTYEFKLGNSFPENEQLYLESWCDEVWGDVHVEPVKIATIKGKHGNGFIMTNGACMPMSKGDLEAGNEIVSETVIGIAAADGENIPYNKSSCVFYYEKV